MKQEQRPGDLYMGMIEEEPQYEDIQWQSRIIQAKIYEKPPEPFSQRLRRATQLGILLTLVTAVIVYFWLPAISSAISGTFFPFWLHGLNLALSQYLSWLQSQSKWIAYIDGALLGSSVVLLIVTRNLRRGAREHRLLAYTQIVGGAGNLLLLLIPIVMYLPNILLWLLACYS
jgi:uncharacterized membrane protein (UPF0136 family)